MKSAYYKLRIVRR